MEWMPSLCGSIYSAATAVGAPIDTRGFASVMAVLVAGGVVAGTATNTSTLAVKIQESASATGTGALWSDITDGAVSAGSYQLSTITITGTNPVLNKAVKSERISDGNRKRFIRAHATCGGTAPVGIKYAVGFLLSRPNDTLYVVNGSTVGTGNVEFTKGL